MKTPLLPVLLLAFGLCGCDLVPGSDGSARTAPAADAAAEPVAGTVDGTMAEPAPVAAPPPASLPPVDILQALTSLDGTAREVLPDGLETIEAGMPCSLDSVNRGAPGFAVSSAEPLFLSGWFAHPPGSAARLVAVLRGERSYAYAAQVADPRPDVAQTIGTTEQVSDYHASGSIAAVAPGEYAVYFIRTDGGSALAKCVADQKVTITATQPVADAAAQ